VRQYFTDTLHVDAKAGVDFLHSYDGQDSVKPMNQISLIDEVDENTTANISFSREYTSNSYTQDLFNSWRVSAGITHQLLKRLRGSLALFYTTGKYTSLLIEDQVFGATAGVVYDLNDHWKANFDYAYTDSSSTIIDRGYVRNYMAMGMRYEF
jgi:hypothetical protein